MHYDVNDFEADVLERSHQIPVLVDFWAEWCAPCKLLGPILERLADQEPDRWVLAKLDTELHPEVAQAYGIQGIPNVKLFSQGKVTAEFVGALPEYAVVQWLKKNIPGKQAGKIEQAEMFAKENKVPEAQKILREILEAEPDNQKAGLLLARTMIFDHQADLPHLLENIDDPSLSEVSEALKTFIDLFDKGEHPEKLAEAPVKQQYLQAIHDLQTQKFDAALEGFINVIRTDRYYDDDGSRKASIAIFKYLGEEHETTLRHRRDFSSALY